MLGITLFSKHSSSTRLRMNSDRMYRARLSLWGFNWPMIREDWYALALLYKARRDDGKPYTEFSVRGQKKTLADLRAYIKRTTTLERVFLAAAQGAEIDPHIRCYTPEPDNSHLFSDKSPVMSDFSSMRSLHRPDQARSVSTPSSCTVDGDTPGLMPSDYLTPGQSDLHDPIYLEIFV